MKRLNDLEYLKLGKFAAFLYKLKLFLCAIPLWFMKLGQGIWGFLKKCGLAIKDEFVDIFDIALSVASIRDKYTEVTVSMNEILNTVRCVRLSCGRCNQDVELLLNQIEHLANKCGYHTERR